jgi:FtsP/CotA-like multicopper oxidase with cupredoxin domain
VKVAMRQTKDGYALTLVIHPNDVPPGLFGSPVGQRYVAALVELDDHEQPVQPRKGVEEPGPLAVQYAGMLCREPGFWHWLNGYIDFGIPKVIDEATAAAALRQKLGIKSRSEIGTDPGVQDEFHRLAADYREWAGIK